VNRENLLLHETGVSGHHDIMMYRWLISTLVTTVGSISSTQLRGKIFCKIKGLKLQYLARSNEYIAMQAGNLKL